MVRYLWRPDTCPGAPGCQLEVTAGQAAIVAVRGLCAFHGALRDAGADDAALFAAIKGGNRDKNTAVAAAARQLGLRPRDVQPRDPAGNVGAAATWSIEPDGSIAIDVAAADVARVRAAVDAAIGTGKAAIDARAVAALEKVR